MGRTRSNKSNLTNSSQGLQIRSRSRRSLLHVSWRDQLVEGMSLTVPPTSQPHIPEYTDPAILAAKPSVVQYTRDELLELRHVPLSQKRPDYLETSYNNSNGTWDPELWLRSRFDGAHENGEVVYKRRSGDPRERIRKEDGIVLSPQRRSFNSGCFVPLKEGLRSARPHSPIGGKSDSNIGQFRDLPPGGRRIGSGRILSRDVPWDYQEKEDDFSFRKERRDDREERFDRRSYGREFDGKEKQGSRNNRFNDRRRVESHEEEPEWFSGGPVSQHETIELRGFDDADTEKSSKAKKLAAPKKKKERRNSEQNENKQPPTIENSDKKDTDVVLVDLENNNTSLDSLKVRSENKINTTDQSMFNLDDILKCDTIAGLLRNGVDSGGGDAGSSRFSQFFTRDSPVKHSESRRSSFQDDHIIRNVLNDITEPNITIPADSDLYFAPISPAASTGVGIGGPNVHSVQKPVNIIEMLQRGKQSNREVPPAKVVSLEELEAKILHHGRNEQIPNVRVPNTSENNTAAFDRLVAQMKTGNVINNGPGLVKVPPVNVFERQQNHMDLMSKLMNAGLQCQQLGSSPLPDLGMNQSRELLNRPEAHAILQAMHQRIPSPRELQQHTQAIMQNALIKKKLEEQQENYKRRQEQQNSGRGVSPAKHTPSPTPLAFTPTSVLRKMTADKDDGCIKTSSPQGRPVTGMKPNLIPAQTWNLQQSKHPAGRPIVKANSSLQAQQQSLQGQHDLQQFYQQQHLYGQQSHTQQRKVGQQQYPSQSGASSTSHHSLHNPMHHQYQFSSNPQQFQQQHLTQHQLRAQHQQHQAPQQTQQPSQYGNKPTSQQHWSQQHHPMLTGHNYDNRSLHLMGDRGSASNNGGELSPIANQLARWFPPELLEKARAGKVPSMPNSTIAQHAINLEEIERHTAPPVHN